VELIPRLKRLINTHYADTKLAITEYYYGGRHDMTGAIAQADALGIFGKEGVFAASVWESGLKPVTAVDPEPYSHIYAAFSMFRNYDGSGGQFGPNTCKATTTDIDKTSVYGSNDGTGGFWSTTKKVVAVALNRQADEKTVSLRIKSGRNYKNYRIYAIREGLTLPPAPMRPQPGDNLILKTKPNALLFRLPGLSVVTIVATEKASGPAWTWVSGASTVNQSATYGTKGVVASSNIPSARTGSSSWIDRAGVLWLFGGSGGGGHLNDLWKFDGTNWTWVSGSSTANQVGDYGSQGVATASNVPGARKYAASWIDASSNLWLFGGRGPAGTFNDLWKFDGANWTWVSGSSAINQPGAYGTKGTPAATNRPGARWGGVSWMDASGNLWLFGGVGFSPAGWGKLNDLWKFDRVNWTWISGSSAINQPGTYGTKGTPAATNHPGGRYSSVGWMDAADNLWLFGGHSVIGSKGGFVNDLWRFDGTNWTWMSGASTLNQVGVYGSRGAPASPNVPGARLGSPSWRSGGNLWLFGGDGPPGGNAGSFNDLWRFDGTNWTWVSGSTTINQKGTYGTKGVPAATNVPGARTWGVSWVDAWGNPWLFGGYTYAGATVAPTNDLWKWR
jgi:hypothetical protein